MEKPASKGITKASPNPKCKMVLIASVYIKGYGTFNIKCPYCQTRIEVIIEQKPKITFKILAIVGACIILGWAAFTTGEVIAEKENCSVYKTQIEAQAHYSIKLDRDKNGKACEHLP